MYMCVRKYMHVYIYTYIYIHIYICTYLLYLYIYTYIHICMYIYSGPGEPPRGLPLRQSQIGAPLYKRLDDDGSFFLTHTHILSLFLSLSLFLYFSRPRAHSFARSLVRSLFLPLSLSGVHTCVRAVYVKPTHVYPTHAHTHTHKHTHTNTHTHTHTHTHKHTHPTHTAHKLARMT